MELTHDFIAKELPRLMPDGIPVTVKSTGETGWLYGIEKEGLTHVYRVEFIDGHEVYSLNELELTLVD